MSVTLAPSPWPAPPAPRQDAGWRFGRIGAQPDEWRFELRRNLCLTPRQLLAAFGLMCGLSLLVAGGFWWHGVVMVGFFAGLELIGLAVALVFVARHAADRETVVVSPRRLQVEQVVGADTTVTAFRIDFVRVEPAGKDGSLVELSGEGQCIRIGRHVRPELRLTLAQELRRALRLARTENLQSVDQDQQA